MTTKITSFIVSCLIIVNLSACKNKHRESTSVKRNKDSLLAVTSNVEAKSDILAEQNYSFKNITNTDFKKLFRYHKDKLYTDSTCKIALKELNQDQKKRLIVPVITKEFKIDPNYVTHYMNAYFVSLQEKSGDYQPIIVKISGDDYDALTMIVLDKNENVVDHYILSGGQEPGPYDIGDSLTVYHDRIESKLDKNKIISYRVIKASFKDSTRNNDYLDSIIFNGQVKTTSGNIIVKKTNEVKRYIKKEDVLY